MSDPNYRALIERARTEIVQKDEEVRRLKSIVGDLSTALERKDSHAQIGEAIVASGKWFEVSAAAKEIAVGVRRGKLLGPNQLYSFMRNTGIIIRRRHPDTGWYYYAPKQDQVDAGRMKLQEIVDKNREDRSGNYVVYRKTLVSAKGVAYLREQILNAAVAGALGDLISD